MHELLQKNKKKFEKQVDKISAKDESTVKDKINDELELLRKKNDKKPSKQLEELISNTELLYQILKSEDFPICDISKKWIVFGLNYLVSDVDLIPDIIPRIGYSDDSMILNWVKNLINDDIERFIKFDQAKHNDISLLDTVVQGSGEQLIILFPGFFEPLNKNAGKIDWVKQIRNIYTGYDAPGISVFNWEFDYLKEFSQTLPMIDHQLSLKPIYDSNAFGIEYRQLRLDMRNLSKHLITELKAIKKANPDKEIIAICLNAGSIPLLNSLKYAEEKIIDEIYLFGATCTEHQLVNSIKNNGCKIFNFFSNNDHALRFIYDNYEGQTIPIGLGELHSLKTTGIQNIDVSTTINHHQDYKHHFGRLINEL